MEKLVNFAGVASVAGLFLLGLSWIAPHGCAQTKHASEAINIFGQCEAGEELVGENLRPTLGYALGSYEQHAGEVRSAATFTVRGDKARGKIIYRYHSRFGLEAFLESQGEEISIAACGEGVARVASNQSAGEKNRLDGISNLSKIDLNKLQSSALEMARERWPDAGIARFRVEHVYPEGHADLTLGDGGSLVIILGASADEDTSLPKGVAGTQSVECLVVSMSRDHKSVTEQKGNLCTDFEEGNVPMRPKCDVRQVWERAVEAGAPRENAVAELSYIASSESWNFSIVEFNENFPDDCI